MFQSIISAFNENGIDPTCLLCGFESEYLPHFIQSETLNSIRTLILVDIEAELRLLTGCTFDTLDTDYKLYIILNCTNILRIEVDQLQRLEFQCKKTSLLIG